MNKRLSISLLITWIFAVLVSASYAIQIISDFKSEVLVTEEKPIETKALYHLFENDTRSFVKLDEKKTIIHTEDTGTEVTKSKRTVEIYTNQSCDQSRNNIHIKIEKIDSLQTPYIKYAYSAKGAEYEIASKRASQIDYQVRQDSTGLYFDSHFNLKDKELYRDQKVTLTLYLPIGSKILIDPSLQYKWIEASYYYVDGVKYRKNTHGIEWTMTEQGLKCDQLAP